MERIKVLSKKFGNKVKPSKRWLKQNIAVVFAVLILLFMISIVMTFYLGSSVFNISPGRDLDAKTWLVFWGSIFSFIGSLFLGMVALVQTKQANKLSKKLINFEEDRNIPIIDIRTDSDIKMLKVNQTEIALQITFDIRRFSKKRKNKTLEQNLSLVLKNVGKTHINFIYLSNFSITEPTKVSPGYMEGNEVLSLAKPIDYCTSEAFIRTDEEFPINILSNYPNDFLSCNNLYIDLEFDLVTINRLNYSQRLQIYATKKGEVYEVIKRYISCANKNILI